MAIPLDRMAGTQTLFEFREIALKHDSATGNCNQIVCRDREYGELKSEDIPGTADVVIPGYLTLEVWDYKTGKTPVDEPSRNAQLIQLALAAVRTLAPRAKHVVVGLQTLKWFKSGECRVEDKAAVLDRWALEEHEQRVRESMGVAKQAAEAIAAGTSPPVNPGPYCRWCPARLECPTEKWKWRAVEAKRNAGR